MKKVFFAACLLLASAALPAQASKPERYIYDPVHTQIMFSVDHLGFSHPHGRFVKFTGGFSFDPTHPEVSQITTVIDTNSIDMCSEEWDRALKGDDFFNVKKFPTMTFKSTKIEKTGTHTGKLTGDLTLLGVTKPVTLDVTYNKSGTHPLSRNFIAGFSATGTIDRTAFGMNYGIPGIGDQVGLDIQVEGIRQDFDSLKDK